MAVAVLAAGWQSVALRPLRLLAVWVHELGHAAMALATGGSVESIAVGADLAGATAFSGGVPALVHLAGPAASLLVGGLLWGWGCRRVPAGRAWLAAGLGALNLVAALGDAIGELWSPAATDDVAALAGTLGASAGAWALGLILLAVGLLLLPLVRRQAGRGGDATAGAQPATVHPPLLP